MLNDGTIVDWFIKSATSNPDRVALEFDGQEWRYDEVQNASDALAHNLARVQSR
jgi:non-ribosomal peptide synthetase component E (peptide arylation enzyme)